METKILYGILDWGLGHASRSIPLLRYLQKRKVHLLIATTPRIHAFLKDEIAPYQALHSNQKTIVYYPYLPAWMSIVLQLKKIHRNKKTEQLQTQKWHQQHHFSGIISDNCYGIFLPNIPSVLISHQINLIVPLFLDSMANHQLHKWHEAFYQVWIPDFNDNANLSGALSAHNNPHLYQYIGFLSRFKNEHTTEKKDKNYDIIAWSSGPSPEKEIFTKKLIQILSKTNYSCLLLESNPNLEKQKNFKNIHLKSHLPTKKLTLCLKSCKIIIAKSGYSTLMDAIALNKTILCIPTPGQSEQIYLQKRLQNIVADFTTEISPKSIEYHMHHTQNSFWPAHWKNQVNNFGQQMDDFLSKLG